MDFSTNKHIKFPVELNERFIKMFLNNFPGTIVITDENAKILFVNDYCLKIWRDDPYDLIGQHVSAFRKNGWAPETGTEYVLANKTRSVKFFKTKYGDGLLTVSIPVFTANNQIEGVITFGLAEEVITDYMKTIQQEKNNMQQLISFLNRNKNEIVAESPKLREILMFLDNIRATDSTIMLYGESGSGKEIFAKYIHQISNRNMQPFVPVNCAAIPNELMESEFFGYEKGAFTGASKEGKLGLFQLAHKGTLFLDEIGELPLPLQAKLLRVIETGELRRIGSEKTIHTDARIIAATNRNLNEMVHAGKFRSDLYFRLNILPVTIPPLCERPEDIEALIHVFLERSNRKYGLNRQLSGEAMKILKNYSWPGNVRELKNVIERFVIISRSDIIEADETSFPNKNKQLIPPHSQIIPKVLPQAAERGIDQILPLKNAMEDFEKQYLIFALELFQGNISEMAQHLNISLSGLYKKLSAYNIKPKYKWE